MDKKKALARLIPFQMGFLNSAALFAAAELTTAQTPQTWVLG